MGMSQRAIEVELKLSTGVVSRMIADMQNVYDQEDAEIAELMRNPPLMLGADETARVRVLLRLATPAAASNLSGGKHRSWTTAALRYSFDSAFHDPEGGERIPDEEFVRTVRRWGCREDAGVWVAPDA